MPKKISFLSDDFIFDEAFPAASDDFDAFYDAYDTIPDTESDGAWDDSPSREYDPWAEESVCALGDETLLTAREHTILRLIRRHHLDSVE